MPAFKGFVLGTQPTEVWLSCSGPARILGPGRVAPSAHAAGAGGGEGSLPRFSLRAYNGGPAEVGWGLPVWFDLAGMRLPASAPVLHQHRRGEPVGHTTKMAKTARALAAVGVMSGHGVSPAAELVRTTGVNGFPWQASVGLLNLEIRELAPGAKATINGRAVVGPAFVVAQSVLKEISFVDFGADDSTSASVVAASPSPPAGTEERTDMPTFSEWLQANHPDVEFTTLDARRRSELTAEYNLSVTPAPSGSGSTTAQGDAGGNPAGQGGQAGSGGTPARQGGAPGGQTVAGGSSQGHGDTGGTPSRQGNPPLLHAAGGDGDSNGDAYRRMLQAHSDALVRTRAIETLCGTHTDIAAALLNDEANGRPWTAEQIRTRVALADIQAGRPSPPRVGGTPTNGVETAHVQAALCLASGVSEKRIVKDFGEKILERADQMRHIGLRGAVELYASSIGVSMPNWNMGTKEWVRAAMSLVDLPNMFESTANRTLSELYEQEPPCGPMVCHNAPVKDFKKVTRFRLDGGEPWKEVSKDGKLESTTGFREQPFEVQATTFGQVIRFSRKDVMNDDLGAMAQISELISHGAGHTVDREFGRVMYAKSQYEAAVNYFSGSSYALGVATLSAAWDAMLVQRMKTTRTNSVTRRVRPAFLLVAANYDRLGAMLLDPDRFAVVGQGASAALAPDANFFKGKLTPKTFMEAGNTDWFGTAATSTHYKPFDDCWWLLAAPTSQFAPAEFSWVGNRRVPFTESEKEGGEGLGFLLRAYIDFGCNPLNSAGVALYQPSQS